MKQTLLFVLLLCCSVSTYAQRSDTRPHHINAGLGIAVPPGVTHEIMGVTADDIIMDGQLFTISYAGDIFRFLALGATFGSRSNTINGDAIAEASSATVTVEPWKMNFLLSDLYLKLPVKNLTIYAKGSAGIGFPRAWRLNAVNESGRVTISTGPKMTQVYGAAGGISYSFGIFEIGIESGALVNSPEFELDLDGDITRQKQIVGTINHSLKVGLRF